MTTPPLSTEAVYYWSYKVELYGPCGELLESHIAKNVMAADEEELLRDSVAYAQDYWGPAATAKLMEVTRGARV